MLKKIEEKKTKTILCKKVCHINVLKQYLTQRFTETREIQSISHKELDKYLTNF